MSFYNTLFIGKVAHHFERLPSTNDYAVDLLAKTKPSEGTVISAAYQTAGRGQFGSTWEVEAGRNLTLSVILYPKFLAAVEQFRLSQAVALAVADTVQGLLPGRPVAIKWPNDIYIGSRKTAGILIQNGLSGARLAWSVIGIGLNVNQTNFPAALRTATSLAGEAGSPFDLETVKAVLLPRLEQRYLQLRAGEATVLVEAYHERLFRRGEWHWFERADGQRLHGRLAGVEPDGRLRIELAEGEVEHFAVKEIRFADF